MKIIIQIAVVFLVCWVGNILAGLLPFPFPGSVLSMVLLFLLLLIKVIRIDHIKEKADFMKDNMAVFFIPAGVGIIDNFQFVKGSILPLLTICLVSTLLTFAATAYTVKGVIYLQNKWRGARQK